MSIILNVRIETGDVIELDRDGELISAQVMYRTLGTSNPSPMS